MDQTFTEKLLEVVKEKISKKQILAVLGIIFVYLMEIPTQLDKAWIFTASKIGAIVVITVIGQLIQWNLDKKK